MAGEGGEQLWVFFMIQKYLVLNKSLVNPDVNRLGKADEAAFDAR